MRLDPKERSIDPAKPLLLRAGNEDTRDSGFYRDRVNGGLPEGLLMGAKDYNNPTKAKDADTLMLTASRFDEFPDIWVTGPGFKDLKKVSNGDSQRAQLLWGSIELVSFKNTDGVPLKGLLLKPENFDPNTSRHLQLRGVRSRQTKRIRQHSLNKAVASQPLQLSAGLSWLERIERPASKLMRLCHHAVFLSAKRSRDC